MNERGLFLGTFVLQTSRSLTRLTCLDQVLNLYSSLTNVSMPKKFDN